MRYTCYHVQAMTKMIQIRNVPDDLHRKLKMRAAKEGVSLSELLLREASRLAETPTWGEIIERIHRQPRVNLTAEQIVEDIRVGRDER